MNSTIDAYEQKAELYRQSTAETVPADVEKWLTDALDGLPLDSSIFEIGSGTGRDASYLASRGYTVKVSDVATSFVRMLSEDGWDATRFDVVNDELPGPWDLVFADAVLLHLQRDDFRAALSKVSHSLSDAGRFAFTLKSGEGEGYSDEKLGLPRFFCYWRAEDVKACLKTAGYASYVVTERPGWLHVVSYKR